MTKRAAHYTKRTGAMICEHIALGCTLQQALIKVGYLAPSETMFWRWIDAHADFREMYDRARQLSADKLADEVLDLGREVLKLPRANSSNYKVAVDVLKWGAEVRNRARYSSKTGEESKKPLNPNEIRKEIKRLESELGLAEWKPAEPQPLQRVK